MIKIENYSAISTSHKIVHKTGTDAYGYVLSAFGCTADDFEEVDSFPATLELSEERREEINDLKARLAEGDYKIIKCYEAQLMGKSMPYDIAELVAERNALRTRINELESMTEAEYWEAYPEEVEEPLDGSQEEEEN